MSIPARTADLATPDAASLLGAPDELQAELGRASDGVDPQAPVEPRFGELGEVQPRRSVYTRLGAPLLEGGIVFAALPAALALAAPIALANLAVFRDPRQILFAQDRVGRDGRTFRILKFRTMREVRGGSFRSWSGGSEQLRVTRFGRFLRNSHLDELPRLVTIVRGDMRLIGPRPEMLEIDSWARDSVPGFEQRTRTRPGLTGLAQVSQGYVGRSAKGYAEKLEFDLVHLARRSLRMDLAVLARTAATMLKLRGWRWDPTPAPDSPSGAPQVPTPNRVWD